MKTFLILWGITLKRAVKVMSYEYKEKIKEDLEYSLEGVSIDYYSSEEIIHKQKVKELEHVYAQAAKVDEYETKAKAFDEIFKLYIGYEDGWISFPRDSKSFNKEIINVCKSYERGESEEV